MAPGDDADNMENLNFPIRNDLSSIDPWHTPHSANISYLKIIDEQ